MPSLCSVDRRALTGSVFSLTLLALAGVAFAQGRTRSAIRDTAGMFGEEAVAKADRKLEEYREKYGVPTVIETVESLQGQPIEDVAPRHAKQAGGEGIYILAARRDHKIYDLASKAFTGIVTEPKRAAIREAFLEGFKQGNYDAGLERGVAMIGAVLAGEKHAGDAPEAETTRPARTTRAPDREEGRSPLVLHNQVRLTLAGAERILAAARAKAVEMGLKMNIAVVDEGGHLIAFARMDGARPASGYTATTKAVTAATFRAPTGPVPPGTSAPDPLLNLSLQNAALASGGKITTLLGGVPVVVDDQVIGGVGVGGGSGEQDATVARAGIDAFQDGLKVHAERPLEDPPAEK